MTDDTVAAVQRIFVVFGRNTLTRAPECARDAATTHAGAVAIRDRAWWLSDCTIVELDLYEGIPPEHALDA